MSKSVFRSKTMWVNAFLCALALFFPDLSYKFRWWPVMSDGVRMALLITGMTNMGLRAMTRSQIGKKGTEQNEIPQTTGHPILDLVSIVLGFISRLFRKTQGGPPTSGGPK